MSFIWGQEEVTQREQGQLGKMMGIPWALGIKEFRKTKIPLYGLLYRLLFLYRFIAYYEYQHFVFARSVIVQLGFFLLPTKVIPRT